MAGRLDAVRVWFVAVAIEVGVDPVIPAASGAGWVDALTAIEWATTELTSRFGKEMVVGAVTATQVAVVSSDGRLLAPGWSPGPDMLRCNMSRP